MEKRKIAIFVEGQSELIVTRELLLKVFEYQGIEIECRNLLEDWNITKADYDYPAPDAKYHFYILNVGNDERVLGVILEQETFLYKNGYDKIIGLRDMYGKKYRDKSKQIDAEINQRFIIATQQSVVENAIHAEKITFHYAIMEVEAWFLALPELLNVINAQLTPSFILEKLGVDLHQIDPEFTFFHPAKTLNDIFNLIGRSYDKKSKTINELASSYNKEDYILLTISGKCKSFVDFYQSVFESKI
jgi:hypothetical protein